MMHVEGFYNGADPCAHIKVYGTKHDLPGLLYTAIVDTGFNDGFLLMPMRDSFELGLTGRGATTYRVGNGARMNCLVRRGTVTFAGKTVTKGLILVAEGAGEILLGPAFLRLFGMKVVIGASTVDFYDQEWLDRALRRTDGKGGGR